MQNEETKTSPTSEAKSACLPSYNFLRRTLTYLHLRGMVRTYYRDMKCWGFTFVGDKPFWLGSLGITPKEDGILISCVGRSKLTYNYAEAMKEIDWHIS